MPLIDTTASSFPPVRRRTKGTCRKLSWSGWMPACLFWMRTCPGSESEFFNKMDPQWPVASVGFLADKCGTTDPHPMHGARCRRNTRAWMAAPMHSEEQHQCQFKTRTNTLLERMSPPSMPAISMHLPRCSNRMQKFKVSSAPSSCNAKRVRLRRNIPHDIVHQLCDTVRSVLSDTFSVRPAVNLASRGLSRSG